MRQVQLEDLRNGDRIGIVFPVDKSAHYRAVKGNFKGFKYNEPEITGVEDLVVFLSETVELEARALSANTITREESSILNLVINEEEQGEIRVFLIQRDGRQVSA